MKQTKSTVEAGDFKKFTVLDESQPTIATDHTVPVEKEESQEELWASIRRVFGGY